MTIEMRPVLKVTEEERQIIDAFATLLWDAPVAVERHISEAVGCDLSHAMDVLVELMETEWTP